MKPDSDFVCHVVCDLLDEKCKQLLTRPDKGWVWVATEVVEPYNGRTSIQRVTFVNVGALGEIGVTEIQRILDERLLSAVAALANKSSVLG